MRLNTSIPGVRTIAQATITSSVTITPNTAFADLMRLSGLNIQGGPVRITVTGAVNLTGTTNTVRSVFFELVHGAGNTVLCGGAVSMTNDEAATSTSQFFSLQFIILSPAVLATDQFAIRWSTGANATANVNGTDLTAGGAVLNVEELSAPDTGVGLGMDTVVLDSVVGNEPGGLGASIAGSFLKALTASADMQVVDVDMSGGGAGNVYMIDFIYRLPQLEETVFYPLLADQSFALRFGSDRKSMVESCARFVDLFPEGVLNFWAEGCSGDGAAWIILYLFETGIDEEGDEELLALRASQLGAQTFGRVRDLMPPEATKALGGARRRARRAFLGAPRLNRLGDAVGTQVVSSPSFEVERAPAPAPETPQKLNSIGAAPVAKKGKR